MQSKLKERQLTAIRDKMYQFISNYHLINPLDDDTFSSYSMFLAFAVVYPGASGKTKQQLENVFGFNKISGNFEACISYLLDVQGHKDTIALENTLWIDKRFEIKKGYSETAQKMKTVMNSANFLAKPEEERVRINKHVEKITHDLIKDLLPINSISERTPFVITNAIYFKDKWKKEFNLTSGIDFKDVGKVKSMSVTCELKVNISPVLTTVSIPYQHDYYMTIVMPEDMKSFEQSTNFKQISKLISSNLKKKTDEVFFENASFKLEKTADLKERLIKLGLVDAFGPNANFDNIANDLYIYDALHKAYICVNEKETEAAASTGLAFLCTSLDVNEPISVTINKPFFAIISKIDALPLFFAKISNPKN